MVREPYSGSVVQKNAAGWTGGVETSRAYYTTPAPKMEEEISSQCAIKNGVSTLTGEHSWAILYLKGDQLADGRSHCD